MSSVPATNVAGQRRRRMLLVSMLVVLAAALGIGYVVWRKTAPPDPPMIPVDGLDPTGVATLEEARAAVLKSPRSGAAWGKLGMVYFAFGYADESGFCLHWAGTRDPENPRWPYLEALTALDQPARALPLLARAVELAPAEPVPRLRYAESLLEQGRLDEAEGEFGRVLDRDPDNPRAHLGLGRLLYQREDLAAARDHLEHSAERASRVRATHALLAEIYGRLNDTAGMEREQSRTAEAVDWLPWPDPYEEEVDQFRVGSQARIAEAEALFNNGRRDEGIALLTQFARNHPDVYAAHVSLGRLLTYQGRFAEAESALRTAVNLKPELIEPQCDLGWLLRRRGEYTEAATHLRRAIQEKPTHARAHYLLADCLSHLGKKKEAVQSYRDAIRCKPDYADAHRDLGGLFAETGDKTEARKELELAVNLAPSDDAARKLLAHLSENP